MVKRGVLRLLLAVAALTAACSDDEGTGPEEGMARLRVVHADAKTGEVDVVVDDIEMASDLSFLDASDYLELEAGSRQVVFLTADSTLDSLQLNLAEGVDYTVFPCCFGAPNSLFLTDDNAESAEGNAKVRVIHFATAPTVDVYVTAPDTDLEIETPTLVSLGSFDASDYFEFSSGDYQIRITTAGTKTVEIDGGTQALGPGEVRTVVVVDAEGGGEPFGLLLLEDAN
jgi:trimeric autotransporter adhesin